MLSKKAARMGGRRQSRWLRTADGGAFLTPIKDADLQNAIVSRRGSSVVLRLLASQDRCQRGMQGLEELR